MIAVEQIRVLTCADSRIKYEKLGVKAYDLLIKEELHAQRVGDDPMRIKIFDIRFKKPLPPLKPFHVMYSFKWTNIVAGHDDYDYVVLKGLKVKKVSFGVTFDWKLGSFRFIEKKNGESKTLTDGDEKDLGNGQFLYSIEVSDPPGDAYELRWDE